jgi:hypothetical protein
MPLVERGVASQLPDEISSEAPSDGFFKILSMMTTLASGRDQCHRIQKALT